MAHNPHTMDWWIRGKQEHIIACFPRQTVVSRVVETSIVPSLCGILIYCNPSQQANVYTVVLPWCTWLSCIIMSEASSTVVVHTARYDNSYRRVSAFMSQQESATCEDILHFNFLSSLSLTLAVQLSLLPGLLGGEERMPAVTDNGSGLADRRPYAGGEVCQSRLHSHFLLSSNPSSLLREGDPTTGNLGCLSNTVSPDNSNTR